MNMGVFLTMGLGMLITVVFGHFYGDKHEYLTTAVFLYSVGSLCSAYCSRLNVDPQLEFNFSPAAYSEAFSLSTNNISQGLLIAVFGLDPILSFGLAHMMAGLGQVCWVLVTFYRMKLADKKNTYTVSLKLEPFEFQGTQHYLLPGSIKFSLSLAYTALVNDFLDQTYFVVFASQESFLGELTLIRGFGSIFVRFIYMPINEVTYNLYAKLYSQYKLEKAAGDSKDNQAFSTIQSIVKMIFWIYSTLCLFFLVYGTYNSPTALTLLFGSKWVNPVTSILTAGLL